jgi:hypothetical protein
MEDDENVGWLVSRTTFSGHLRSDLIRITALSMISGRSAKLAGGSGKDQPATSRRTTSALPTTIKYLAMGTADSSRELSNRGQPMAATLDYTHAARQLDRGAAPPRRAFTGKTTPRLEEILLHHFPDVASPAMQDGAGRIKSHPDRRLYLRERRHDKLHRVDVHVQKCGPWLRQPVLDRSLQLVCVRNRLAPET